MPQENYTVQLDVNTLEALNAVESVERALNGLNRIKFEVDSSSISGIIDKLDKIKDHTKFNISFSKDAASGLTALTNLANQNQKLRTTAQHLKTITEALSVTRGGSSNTAVGNMTTDTTQLAAQLKTVQALMDSLGKTGGSTSKSVGATQTARQYITQLRTLYSEISSLEAKREISGLNASEAKALQSNYDAINHTIDDANASLKTSAQLTQVTTAQVIEEANARERIKKIIEEQAEAQKKAEKREANSDQYLKDLNKRRENYAAFEKQTDQTSRGLVQRLDKYKNTLDELEKVQKRLSSNPDNTDDQLLYRSLQIRADEELSKYKKARTKGYGNNYVGNIGIDLIPGSSRVQTELSDLASQMNKGKIIAQEYDGIAQKLNVTFDSGAGKVEKYALSYDTLTGNVSGVLKSSTQKVRPFSEYLTQLGNKFGELSRYAIASVSVYEVFNVLKQGVGVVRELNSAMTELKKTSEGTTQDYSRFLTGTNQTAKEIGTTTTELVNSAADWSRLGYSLEDSQTMAKNSSILLNVSEYENISEATDALISTMKAFDVQAEDSMTLIDKMNLIGNNYAISTNGISDALMRSSSALVAANNDIDESIALITAANEIEQDPAKVGNGLRTISLRLRGTEAAKRELEESGEEVEDYTVGVSKLQDQIKGFTKVSSNDFKGFDILTQSGDYKSTYEILLGIAEVWDEIGQQSGGDLKQAALLELIAGKNRANIAASILQNPDTLKAVYEDSANNYVGSAANELNTYLDSIDAHMIKLQETWNQIWQNGISSDFINGILDFGTGILSVVEKVGLLNTSIGLLGAGLGMFKKVGRVKMFALSGICPHNPGGNAERVYADMVA